MSCTNNNCKKYTRLDIFSGTRYWCVELPGTYHVYEFTSEKEADVFMKGCSNFIDFIKKGKRNDENNL